MKITCPNCDTSYNIGPNSVGPEGRSVRCSRCSEEWYIDSEGHAVSPQELAARTAEPPEDDDAEVGEDDWAAAFEEAAPDTDAEPEEADGETAAFGTDEEDAWKAELGLDDDEEEDAEPEPASAEAPGDGTEALAADRPRRARSRKRSPYDKRGLSLSPEVRAMLGLALFLGSIVLCVAVVLMREPIVRTAPGLAGLYRLVGLEVNLRGLEFRDLRTFQEYENGGVVLIVEGEIGNLRKRSNHVPAIQLSLRSSDAQDIYSWTIEPRVRRLPGGQTLRFSTRVASPPAIATDVEVSFTDRDDKQAKL